MDHEKYSRKCPTSFKGVQPVRCTITRVGLHEQIFYNFLKKLHLRYPVAKELGLATIYQRGGSKGVTLYEAVDKNLGILLAISIQQLHEKTKDCALEALRSTFNFNLLRSLLFNNFLTY